MSQKLHLINSTLPVQLGLTGYIGAHSDADQASYPVVFYFASIMEKHLTYPLSASEYVRAIAEVPSATKTPASLAIAVLGLQESSPEKPRFREVDLLKALATEELGQFDISELDVSARARLLAKADRPAARDLFSHLIASESITELGNEILVEICGTIEVDDLESVNQGRPGILNLIIKQNPSLATSPAIWKANQIPQTEIFHALMSSKIDSSILRDAIGAILLSGRDDVAECAFQYGDRLVIPIIEWFREKGSGLSRIPKLWRHYLALHANEAMEWLRAQSDISALLPLLASSLPADAPAVMKFGLRKWLPAARRYNMSEGDPNVSVGAFYLALGLSNCQPAAMELVRVSFQAVHDAAAHGALDHDSWRPISDIAPPLHWWRDWDKCERLRAALLDKFASCKWPSTEMFRVITSSATLEKLFALSSTTKTRGRFLKRTAKCGLDLPLSSELHRIVKKFS